jgi:hypothetical protein
VSVPLDLIALGTSAATEASALGAAELELPLEDAELLELDEPPPADDELLLLPQPTIAPVLNRATAKEIRLLRVFIIPPLEWSRQDMR